jgi:hypothetical protein
VIEADRTNGSPAADGDAGNDRVVAERILDGRDRAEVDLARVEAFRDL